MLFSQGIVVSYQTHGPDFVTHCCCMTCMYHTCHCLLPSQAFRGEFAVFSPLPGCFEHFGLDFVVDEDFQVWLLEANPGPDFKQVCGCTSKDVCCQTNGSVCVLYL